MNSRKITVIRGRWTSSGSWVFVQVDLVLIPAMKNSRTDVRKLWQGLVRSSEWLQDPWGVMATIRDMLVDESCSWISRVTICCKANVGCLAHWVDQENVERTIDEDFLKSFRDLRACSRYQVDRSSWRFNHSGSKNGEGWGRWRHRTSLNGLCKAQFDETAAIVLSVHELSSTTISLKP